MKPLAFLLLLVLLVGCDKHEAQHNVVKKDSVTTMIKDGYLDANGLHYYYQVHGKGEPLLLLHGGMGQIEMMKAWMPALTANNTVIAVDLHGHGRTQLANRAIDLADIGDDMSVIISQLGYKQVDVVGYSFGGGIALRLAIQHPQMVRKLVVVSAPYSQAGFFPELLPMQAAVSSKMLEAMKPTFMYKAYAAVAPDTNEFPKLLDRMGEFMRKPYDYSAEVKALAMPVMLMYGDADMVQPSHIIEFYKLLGGGLKDAGWQREHMSKNRLAIIPNVTHYEVFNKKEFAEEAVKFLGSRQ